MNLVAFDKPNWPLPKMHRRDRGRLNLWCHLFGVLDERRRRGPGDEDFVDTLVQARYANGKAMTDDEIVGLLLTLIFAGQHTSAVMAAWTGILLLQHPDHLGRVRTEQQSADPAKP